jgi:hypothetical protein
MTPIIFGTRFYFATKPESLWRRLPQERFRLWQQVVRLAPGHCAAALTKDLRQIVPWCVPLENGPLEGRLRPPKTAQRAAVERISQDLFPHSCC